MKSQAEHMIHQRLAFILKLSTFAILSGHAWEHFVYDPPYHAFFWDYTYFGWFVEGVLGIEWDAFLTTPAYDDRLHLIQRCIGVIFLLTALLSWTYSGKRRGVGILLIVSSVFMFLLALLNMKDKFGNLGQLLEMSVQVSAPLLLYFFFSARTNLSVLFQFTRLVVALTFIGHGLYAIGFYRQPPEFIKMIRGTTGMSYMSAVDTLRVVGVFDILAALFLYIPNDKIFRITLGHIIVWGFVTALGRLIGNVSPAHMWFTFKQLWHLTLYRLSHGLIPLFLYFLSIYLTKHKMSIREKMEREIKID